LIAEGTVYTSKILNREDLNRQLVKSATCTVIIPQFELTIPPSRGQLTTVEGLIRDIITDLGADQPLRKYQNEAAYIKIQDILNAFNKIVGDKKEGAEVDTKDELFSPFTISLDDPAGNSFIEFIGSMSDPKWNLRTYHRTRQQNVALGIAAPDDDPSGVPEDPNHIKRMKESVDNAIAQAQSATGDYTDDEILIFPGTCSSCGKPLDTLMKKVVIPYFKVW
jgi:zinc finger protein